MIIGGQGLRRRARPTGFAPEHRGNGPVVSVDLSG
jgi:hypothetical protein